MTPSRSLECWWKRRRQRAWHFHDEFRIIDLNKVQQERRTHHATKNERTGNELAYMVVALCSNGGLPMRFVYSMYLDARTPIHRVQT
jgi:hypothetical protein